MGMEISCASCHLQEFAFGDTAVFSPGVAGVTGRHSMRLVNNRFSDEAHYFWDERAANLEEQSTMPIRDHIEMGFSGLGNDPDFDSLITRLQALEYYNSLFTAAFGDSEITEERMQLALAQFVRSIQSFDTPFDEGISMVVANNVALPFPNYTAMENLGKTLFLQPIPLDGGGCAGCHVPPEFNIDPLSLNNGVIIMGGTTELDLTNTKSPSLREMVNPQGLENGPFMHDGSLATLMDVINHYNFIPPNPLNTNLDPRLAGGPNGLGQNLNLAGAEKDALIAFLKTLSGTAVYSAEQWSDPFGEDGSLEVIGLISSVRGSGSPLEIQVFTNPTADRIEIRSAASQLKLQVYSLRGEEVLQSSVQSGSVVDLSPFAPGTYLFRFFDEKGGLKTVRVVKQ
jgi:cytochrome c peroxidase